MQFVVTHLTKMRNGICVAGPEIFTGAMIRPVVRFNLLQPSLLARFGGPLEVGAVVDLGVVRPRPQAPHSEDLESDPSGWRALSRVSGERFLEHLQDRAVGRPVDAFGAGLHAFEHGKHALRPGEGSRSLAYLKLEVSPQVVFNDAGRLNIVFVAGGERFRLSVTDIRLYRDEMFTPDATAVGRLQRYLWERPGAIVGIGIGRAWARQGESEMHWLQVNNVFPLSAPLWGAGTQLQSLSASSRFERATPAIT